ncbi:hypothetical protein C8R44DRAFT_893218 [Mycena epipterygia]|nr:hypothetical protein C8R44DRAFT_893218 [Mycena epipterygia]
MAYDPEATRRSWLWRRPRALFLIAGVILTLLALTALFGPATGLPIPDSLSEYDPGRPFPPPGGNPPPPPHSGAPQVPPPPLPQMAIPTLKRRWTQRPPSPGSGTSTRRSRRYTLKTGRAPPHGFDAFVDYAGRHGCLVDAYDGVHADFLPFWRAEEGGEGRRV